MKAEFCISMDSLLPNFSVTPEFIISFRFDFNNITSQGTWCEEFDDIQKFVLENCLLALLGCLNPNLLLSRTLIASEIEEKTKRFYVLITSTNTAPCLPPDKKFYLEDWERSLRIDISSIGEINILPRLLLL